MSCGKATVKHIAKQSNMVTGSMYFGKNGNSWHCQPFQVSKVTAMRPECQPTPKVVARVSGKVSVLILLLKPQCGTCKEEVAQGGAGTAGPTITAQEALTITDTHTETSCTLKKSVSLFWHSTTFT